MKALEEAIRQDVEDARRQSQAAFETIFTEHDTSIKDQLKKVGTRLFRAELKRLGDDLAERTQRALVECWKVLTLGCRRLAGPGAAAA